MQLRCCRQMLRSRPRNIYQLHTDQPVQTKGQYTVQQEQGNLPPILRPLRQLVTQTVLEDGEIVVTLQENNHIAVVSAEGEIINHFSAGKVDLYDIDVFTNGYYKPNGSRQGVRREPDGVKWIDNDHFVTANEGDYKIKLLQ